MSSAGLTEDVDRYLTPPPMDDVPRWEYAILRYDIRVTGFDAIGRQINEMGAHGWELTSRPLIQADSPRQHPAPDTYLTLVFKRQIG